MKYYKFIIIICLIFSNCHDQLPDLQQQTLSFKGLSSLQANKVLKSKPLNFIFYLNVSCPSCVYELEKIKKDIKGQYANFNFIIICHSNDNFIFFENLLNTKEIEVGEDFFYLDSNKIFYRNNSFLTGISSSSVVKSDSLYNFIKILNFK